MSILIAALLLLFTPMTATMASAATADEDFDARCHGAPKTGLAPSADGIVLRCFGFDSAAQLPSTGGGPGSSRNWGKDFGVGSASGTPVIDTTVKASGAGSMMMRNFVGGGSDSFGSWFTHFGVNKTGQMNTGDDRYIQFRVRWSPEMIVQSNWPNGAGFKVKDVSLGDLATCDPDHPDSTNCPTSCPNQTTEWVTQQVTGGNSIPFQNYANCGGNFGFKGMYGPNNMVQNGTGCLYPNYPEPPCVKPHANEWFTFKYHIKMGTFNTFSTVLQMWIAREGQPSVLVVDCSPTATTKCVNPDTGAQVTGWNLEMSGGAYQVGKIWLHPYMSNMSGSLVSGAAWYDELIISTQDIPDPGTTTPGLTPSAPCCLSLTKVGPMSLVVLGAALLRRWRRRTPRSAVS